MALGEAAQSALLRLHQKIYEATGGRLGHRMLGVPCLLLHSTGRKTGQPRTAALVYAQDGSSYVVVASKGGADQPPGWLHNVEAQPDVQVQLGPRTQPARAEILTPGHADYERLWHLVNANNRHRYDEYQRKTTRPIALVRLTPSTG